MLYSLAYPSQWVAPCHHVQWQECFLVIWSGLAGPGLVFGGFAAVGGVLYPTCT